MDLIFERGSQEAPRGHALLYFRSRSKPEEIWATYVVILPITVDVTKYIPPFLVGQMGTQASREFSAFAFPPAPERLEGHDLLDALAELRDDDVLFGGEMEPGDVPQAIMQVGQIVEAYAELYAEATEMAEATMTEDEAGDEEGAAVSDVLYSLMSERDRLSELTKLVGKLRFAVEGGEEGLVRETEEEINLLARHLPEGCQIQRLIEAAKSDKGAHLANLYLQRCFYLVQEEYAKVAQVEREIQELEARRSSS